MPDTEEPKKPSLKMAQVNTIGTLYSTHLALHYFVKQNGQTVSPQQEDCCLILIGSGAAFLDCPRTPEYQASKFANRGIIHAMRQQLHHCGARVNLISPWSERRLLTECLVLTARLPGMSRRTSCLKKYGSKSKTLE